MFERERPDIVSVCATPRRRSVNVQDLVHGRVKGIWAEKPITLTLEDAVVARCPPR
jgi:predicted dehydrogenase